MTRIQPDDRIQTTDEVYRDLERILSLFVDVDVYTKFAGVQEEIEDNPSIQLDPIRSENSTSPHLVVGSSSNPIRSKNPVKLKIKNNSYHNAFIYYIAFIVLLNGIIVGGGFLYYKQFIDDYFTSQNINEFFNTSKRQNIEAIVIIERKVISHPTVKDALLITLKLSNQANYVQQFPALELTFSDINEKVLASRTFEPKEYLHESVNIEASMQPRTPIDVKLEIVDPGESAVNFVFKFH